MGQNKMTSICYSVAVCVLVASVCNALPPVLQFPMHCNFTVEIMFLQDYSDSSADERKVLRPLFEQLLSDIDVMGGKTGFASFVDKPLDPLGYSYQGPWFEGDWCLRLATDLEYEGTPSEEMELIVNEQPGGGNDFAENQLGALHDIAKGDLAKWSAADYNEHGQRVRRVVVLSTDSAYHIAGDGQKYYPDMAANDGGPETNCTHEDYPTIAQVREGLESRDIYTVFLIANNTIEKDLIATYEELLETLGDGGGAVYNFDMNGDGEGFFDVFDQLFEDLERDTCDATLDVMFSQDVTWSYSDDRAEFREGMTAVLDSLEAMYKDSRFGLTSFGDKPLGGFGDGPSGDYCVRLNQELTTDKTVVEDAALNLPLVSGLDWRESQLDAFITTALDGAVGWRQGDEWQGVNLYRLIVLSTDSGFHYAPDAADKGFNLLPHPLTPINQAEGDCVGWEYPTSDQVAQLLADAKIMPVFVPTPGMYGKYDTLIKHWKATFGLQGAVVKLGDFGDWTGPTTRAIKRLLQDKRRLDSSYSKSV